MLSSIIVLPKTFAFYCTPIVPKQLRFLKKIRMAEIVKQEGSIGIPGNPPPRPRTPA